MAGTILIIGDGAMACVCSKLLSAKGHPLRLWSAFADQAQQLRRTRRSPFLPELFLEESLEITADEAEAFAGACLAISAVPCQYIRGVWQRLAPHCPSGLPICSVTKGIETRTLLRPSQILSQVLTSVATPPAQLAVLSGPSISREVVQEMPATVVSASADLGFAQQIQRIFSTSYFRVYAHDDLVGVELAGATKNIIAIAAGILDGMHAGDNAKASLLTRGLWEITRLGVQLGGRRETFFGLAGTGDLVTTCVSPYGRNRTFGEAIGRGRSVQEAAAAVTGVVEGIATTASVMDLAARCGVAMPITQAVHSVLFEGKAPAEAIAQLMSRPLKNENA